MKKNNKGFSLVELLAVIVVLAIVAAVTMTVIVPMLSNKPAEAATLNLKEINSVVEKSCAANDLNYSQYGTIEGFTEDCLNGNVGCHLNPTNPATFIDNLNVIGDAPSKLTIHVLKCVVQTSCIEYTSGQFNGITVKYNNGTIISNKTTDDWKC